MKASPSCIFVGGVILHNAGSAGGERAHMERQDDMLRDDFAGAIQNRAAGVLRLADNRRVAGAEQRILHFLDDAGQARLDDLQGDGIDCHRMVRQRGVRQQATVRRSEILPRALPRLAPVASCLLLNDDIPIFIHGGFLLGLNHGRGVQLLDDRGAGDFVARLEKFAVVNLRHQHAMLFAEEDFARAGFRRLRLCVR